MVEDREDMELWLEDVQQAFNTLQQLKSKGHFKIEYKQTPKILDWSLLKFQFAVKHNIS